MRRRASTVTKIREASYENGTLEIKTQMGETYQYRQVPEVLYRQLISTQYAGQWYDRYIKNKYPVRKIPLRQDKQ